MRYSPNNYPRITIPKQCVLYKSFVCKKSFIWPKLNRISNVSRIGVASLRGGGWDSKAKEADANPPFFQLQAEKINRGFALSVALATPILPKRYFYKQPLTAPFRRQSK
jgi:hypothetical protein